jgi:uncharacterized protein YoxC
MNYEKLKDWQNDARRGLEREVEHIREKEQQLNEYLRAMEATDELLSEVYSMQEALERKQAEIDNLSKMVRDKEEEISELRRQLLEAKETQQPMEIHNHFDPGSSAQVFNSKVTGKFRDKKFKWKRQNKKGK